LENSGLGVTKISKVSSIVVISHLEFYNQPMAHRFGNELVRLLSSPDWLNFDVAVAWVRRSGTRHLKNAIQSFIAQGKIARFSVGLDVQNTSSEGLEDLLELENYGLSETYVYHNEANVVYHPKLYLFSNSNMARLIVGSNNVTEAGLFRNTEAGLEIDGPISLQVFQQASIALASWRDTSSAFVRKLDRKLLDDLLKLEYVRSESKLDKITESATKTLREKRTKYGPLFGSREISAPPASKSHVMPTNVVGTVLLMRVRRASETSRRTQIQIPIRVIRTSFFENESSVISAHDSKRHSLIQATARGGLNTIKLEIPEINSINDPILRLERSTTGILYQAFDAKSTLGIPIMEALEQGRRMKPGTTELTKPDNPQSSTWWRFI